MATTDPTPTQPAIVIPSVASSLTLGNVISFLNTGGLAWVLWLMHGGSGPLPSVTAPIPTSNIQAISLDVIYAGGQPAVNAYLQAGRQPAVPPAKPIVSPAIKAVPAGASGSAVDLSGVQSLASIEEEPYTTINGEGPDGYVGQESDAQRPEAGKPWTFDRETGFWRPGSKKGDPYAGHFAAGDKGTIEAIANGCMLVEVDGKRGWVKVPE